MRLRRASSVVDGASDEAIYLVSIMIAGTLSQAMANEPDLPWGEGRFSPLFPETDVAAADGVPARAQTLAVVPRSPCTRTNTCSPA